MPRRRRPWSTTTTVPLPSSRYGFLNGPGRWVAWLALAGVGVAGLAIIPLIVGLARQRDQLIVQRDELARLAAVDPLTGLRNRRAIEEYLHDALSAARRHRLPLSLLVIDVGRPRGAHGSDRRPSRAKSAAPSANLIFTRERRWSDCLKVLAGPWRCPAAKPEADPA
jgi:Diguanylate cyclase, GGDEF domain